MTTKVHFCATSIAEQWEFELTVLSFDVVVNGKMESGTELIFSHDYWKLFW